jgi:hypothetical protein
MGQLNSNIVRARIRNAAFTPLTVMLTAAAEAEVAMEIALADVADEVIVEDQDVADATATQSMESMYQTLRGILPHKNGRL